MKKLIVILVILAILSSCKSFDDTIEPTGRRGQHENGEEGRRRPKLEKIIAKMDNNKDGKLSKEEIQGPLVEKFNEVDTNKDGFITLEELKDAPKRERKDPPMIR